MCSWNKHYCWPGTCGENLSKNCNCATGFTRVSTTTGETTCQPITLPTILDCDTTILGPDKKRTLPGKCAELNDFYGRFQPDLFKYKLTSDFAIDITSLTKPEYISESNFGVSDTTIYILKESINGMWSFYYFI